MPKTKIEKTPGADKPDRDVLKALQAAAKGLLFPSESDKPVKAFLWEGTGAGSGAVDAAALKAAALKAAGKVPDGAKTEVLTLEMFFDPVITPESWWGDEEKATAKQYQDLIAALNDNLTDLTVLRVEGIGDDSSLVDAYVLGRTSAGEIAGVSTQLIET